MKVHSRSVRANEKMFEILAARSRARRPGEARLATNHAMIETPCFMPVGTRGALKGVAFDWLEDDAWDCRVVLANTYHLMTRRRESS